MSKKLMCMLCLLIVVGRGNSQSPETTVHTYAQIFNENNEMVTSLSLKDGEAQAFDFENYVLKNKDAHRLSLSHTIRTELLVERHVYRTILGAEGNNLCISTEVTATPMLGVAVSSTPNFHGVKVDRVLKGGPADNLGIQVNDVLYSFNDTELSSHCDLQIAVRQSAVGSEAALQYASEGISHKDNITIGAQTVNTHTYTLCDSNEDISLNEPSSEEMVGTLSTYPNPTRRSSFINFKSEVVSPIKFNIIDMNGSLIHSEEHEHFSGEMRLEYLFESSAQPGAYLFVIEQGEARHYNKVLYVKE